MSSSAAESCCDSRKPGVAGFLPDETSLCPNKNLTPETVLPKTKILFVDDEPAMVRVLKMGMRSMAEQWEMSFAEGGEAGLELVKQQNFDVIVTDMRMAGINGAQLLNYVLRHNPQTVRIILSGYADLSEVVSCVGLTHQFLTKPCSLDDLKSCLKKVTGIKHQLGHEKLRELTGGLTSLPGIPELYLEIAEALQSPLTSSDRIAESLRPTGPPMVIRAMPSPKTMAQLLEMFVTSSMSVWAKPSTSMATTHLSPFKILRVFNFKTS